jgi:hypothetical protein
MTQDCAAQSRGEGIQIDRQLPDLRLVKPNGGKLWRWNYSYSGKQKSMNSGIYPMISLLDARAKRDEARAILDDGRDPGVVKKL